MKGLLALIAVALVAGCGERRNDGPIQVSAIGRPLAPESTPDPLDAPRAALIGATRQGLVRFDAGGGVAPGLAARWTVTDPGTTLLFRLPDLGAPVPGAMVAAQLRTAIAPGSRNPLRPLLGAMTAVTAVTPQVIDVELAAPRPNILQLFAQPALAMGDARRGGGPFELRRLAGGVATLRLRPDPDADPDATPPPPLVVQLRGEGAARAVARFASGRAGLVLGGGFADLAIARAATLPAGALRFDPAPGLFGLVFAAATTGFTAAPEARAALAEAIDRDRIGRALDVPGWTPATAIVAAGTPELPNPAQPVWATLPLDRRQEAARATVAAWRAAGHPLPPLRVAMPGGPGARLLFALVAADWRAIGVEAVAVGPGEPADLAFEDAVAPADTAAFYLRRFACERGVPCTAAADEALIAARAAPTLAARAALFAQADAAIATTTPFIALGPPVRWSLVADDLDGYRDSPRAIHPLDELRGAFVR